MAMSAVGVGKLQEATFENDLEEIVAHEDPRGRFIAGPAI
jgi:hypothetical protein